MHADLFELKSLYFNSAYLGPAPKHSVELTRRALQRSLDPAFLSFEDWSRLTDENRARLARLLGTAPESIALSTSVSELVSHVANGMELHAQDEILLMDGDYPSMILPWLVLAELKGFRVNLLPKEEFLHPERFKKHLHDRTRFAGCSHVMFNTGAKLPVAELAAEARKKEILFLADVSQSFGGMRITPEILNNVGILVGVAYKWLLGPYGTAFGYFNGRALKEVRRTHASWLQSPNSKTAENLLNYTTDCLPGARKFDRGQSHSFLINAALEGALETLQSVGLEKIEKHNAELVNQFLEGLPKHYQVSAPQELRSNIVCIKPADEEAATVKANLAKKNIDVTIREGNVRVSFHLFNTSDQVQKLLQEI